MVAETAAVVKVANEVEAEMEAAGAERTEVSMEVVAITAM